MTHTDAGKPNERCNRPPAGRHPCLCQCPRLRAERIQSASSDISSEMCKPSWIVASDSTSASNLVRSQTGLLFEAGPEFLHSRPVLAPVEQAEQRAGSKVDALRLGVDPEVDLVPETGGRGEDHLQCQGLAANDGCLGKGLQGGLKQGHGLRRRPGV